MAQSKQKWPSDEDQKTIEYKVYSILMGEVEDPDLFVAQPIYEWQQTEAGKYVMENSVPTPMWRRSVDMGLYGHQYMIFAYFTPKQLTYYKLKYE
jgi:hypothetical protein